MFILSFLSLSRLLYLLISCVGVEEYQSNDIETYHCPNCQLIHGPLICKYAHYYYYYYYYYFSKEETKLASS